MCKKQIPGYASADSYNERNGILISGGLSVKDLKEKKIKEALSFVPPALIVNGNPIKIVGTGGSGMNPEL